MIKVLLAECRPSPAESRRKALDASADICVVAHVATAEHATAAVRAWRPDIVLVDAAARAGELLEPLTPRPGQAAQPRAVLLVESGPGSGPWSGPDGIPEEILLPGVVGVVPRKAPDADVIAAVRAVAAGSAVLPADVVESLISRSRRRPAEAGLRHAERLRRLTQRERDVLRLVGAGLTNSAIGGRLFMSEATVKSHLSKIMEKLGCSNRVQAALLAHTSGLTESVV